MLLILTALYLVPVLLVKKLKHKLRPFFHRLKVKRRKKVAQRPFVFRRPLLIAVVQPLVRLRPLFARLLVLVFVLLLVVMGTRARKKLLGGP